MVITFIFGYIMAQQPIFRVISILSVLTLVPVTAVLAQPPEAEGDPQPVIDVALDGPSSGTGQDTPQPTTSAGDGDIVLDVHGSPHGGPSSDGSTSAESAGQGPAIHMPASFDTPVDPGIADAPSQPDVDSMRGMQQARFDRAAATSLGGYGELHYNLRIPEGDGDNSAVLDMHRMVLFVAHNFSDRFRFYSEIEIEHAFVAGEDSAGELGLEQAYLDWRLLDDALSLRAGILLVPMGITNQWHEPPVFHGVERPMVDKVIIPSTWREGGVGIFGEPTEGLRYELYLVSGLDPAGFSLGNGLRGGRQHVAKARMNGLALTGRVEYEPMLGLVAGISGYAGLSGPNLEASEDLDVPVLGGAVDVRLRRSGVEAKAVAAVFTVGDGEALRMATDSDGAPLGLDVADQMFGAYGEVAYDVLSLTDCEMQLLPFARLEWYDTTLGHEDSATEGSRATMDLVFGLSFRPIPEAVMKGNVIVRSREGDGNDDTLVDLGVGWMF